MTKTRSLKSPKSDFEKYQKCVQSKIEEIISVFDAVIKYKRADKIKMTDLDHNKPLKDLCTRLNKHLDAVNAKLPELLQCNINLEHSVEELEKAKQNILREKILENAIIDHMGECMFVTDLKGSITIINRVAKETLGYSPDLDLRGENALKLINWLDKTGKPIKGAKEKILNVLGEEEIFKINFTDDWYCERKDGTTFPVAIYASPVRLNGEMKAIVVLFHDATKEKRIDAIKSDFISIASHQLRTPLAVSTLHTEMLLAGHLGELNREQKEYAQEIAFYNKKMADLLNVFLSVSKIEMDTFSMELKPLDIGEVLDDAIREMTTIVEKKEIVVTKKYEKNLPKVLTDEGLLRVALQNLVSNAVKYTATNGKVSVETKVEDGNVIIRIKDNGVGVSETDKARIFLKLYRGRNVKKAGSEGTGLGLYIAKSFIEKCRGKIWFRSLEHKGTTFYVSLPISKQKTKNIS